MLRATVASLVLALAASDPAVPPVRLDAVVTDPAGRPIVDLRAADFELRVNGVVSPIETIELRTSTPGGTRAFAFLLDEYHVSAGPATERAREALARFVARELRPGDRTAVIKPLDRVTAIPFSTDVEALRASIATFAGRKGDYAPRTAFEEQYIGRAPAAVESARRQIVSSALREIALRLGGAAADRGVIVLVSEGFSRTAAPGLREVRIPDLQAFVRAASRFHLALYAFDPSEASEGAGDRDTLEWLAGQTGGRASSGGALLDEGLRRMAADLDSYYAVTYRPGSADGRYHPVQLTARRKNAVVRTRPGYWAPFADELRGAGASEPVVPRRALHRSAAIIAWTGISRDAGGGMRLSVTWEPPDVSRRAPSRPLAAQPRAVRLTARTPAGATLFEGEIAAAGAATGNLGDLAAFDAPAGRIELDMAIKDVRGVVLDTDVRDVDVPDLGARATGPVILTPEVIRARTAPEFRALSANPAAAPTPSRTFGRGDRLLIRAQSWDPSGTAAAVTAMVVNAIGGPIRPIDPVPGPAADRPTFDLPLAWLAPGEYAIVLSAKTARGQVTETVRFIVR